MPPDPVRLEDHERAGSLSDSGSLLPNLEGLGIRVSGHISPQIVSGLQEEILRLRFPHRVQSKEPTPKVKRKGLGGIAGGNSPSKSPPTLGPQQALSDRPCLVVLHKPLDKLLIR